MRRREFLVILCTLLMTLSLAACNLPTGQVASTPDINGTVAAQVAIAQAAQTMVAETLGANSQAGSNNPANQAAPSATNTLQEILLNTVAPTLTPTITQTPTPEGVFLVLSQDTYCRVGGPYSSFKVVVTVKAGDKVEVISQNPEKDSYYVKNPYQGNSTCWLWGKYATLTGNVGGLPIATMQPTPTPTNTPTPTPGFTVTYSGLEHCGANYAFKLFIRNTGGLIWQSINLTGSDTTTAFAFNQSLNVFKEYAGCSTSTQQDDLTPGEESYVLNTESGQFFNYDPTGHPISLTVTLCSTDGLAGTCKSIPVTFTP
jgi:hypothetical protein